MGSTARKLTCFLTGCLLGLFFHETVDANEQYVVLLNGTFEAGSSGASPGFFLLKDGKLGGLDLDSYVVQWFP